VLASRSVEGAVILAGAASEKKDYRAAIQFLLLARKGEDAFSLAVRVGEMEVYVNALFTGVVAAARAKGDPLPPPSSSTHNPSDRSTVVFTYPLSILPKSECLRVGRYYDGKGEVLRAGQFFTAAGDYSRALSILLSAASKGGEGANANALLEEAVRLAGEAKSPTVTSTLLAFLRGESTDSGGPKDARLIFSLFMALGNHSAAAAEALAIAKAEQESANGSFKTAHGMLFDAYCSLVAAGARPPSELWRSLTLLHSYLLVKKLITVGEHEGAARMLVRVVKNISRFPAHATPILTSAVVQCQRGGLKSTGSCNPFNPLPLHAIYLLSVLRNALFYSPTRTHTTHTHTRAFPLPTFS